MKRGGFALVTSLMLCAVLLILIGAMVHRVRQGAAFQLAGRYEINALAAAESGLDDVLQRWSQTPAWEGPLDVTLPGGESSYHVRFGSQQSVNNLLGLEARDGPPGSLSVPAGLAYVVVEGRSAGRVHRLEALVGPQGLTGGFHSAILATRDIHFQGDVQVDGRRSFDDATPVDADVVTTSRDARDDIIRSDSGASINIQGSVRANSNQPGSIQSGVASGASKGPRIGEAVAVPAAVNVVERIDLHNTSPAPSMTGLFTRLPAGDYYMNGDFNYSGDLKLNGANLYVKGDVVVTGSIGGKGSVFAAGSTSLYGDADLDVGNDAAVALYSKGDVTLEGINGNAYLRQVAQDARSAGRKAASGLDYLDHLNDFRDWSPQLAAAMTRGYTPTTMPIALNPGTTIHEFSFGNRGWNYQAPSFQTGKTSFRSDADAIAKLLGNIAPPTGDYGFVHLTSNDPLINPLTHLQRLLEDPAAGDSFKNRLLRRRLNAIVQDGDPKKGLLATHGGATDVIDCQTDLLATATAGESSGLLDAINDAWNQDWSLFPQLPLRDPAVKKRLFEQSRALVENLGQDELATTRFRGLVYTEGNLTIRNDLRVEGALYAIGPASNIVLDRVKVTYVPELASRAGQSLGVIGIKTWYRH